MFLYSKLVIIACLYEVPYLLFSFAVGNGNEAVREKTNARDRYGIFPHDLNGWSLLLNFSCVFPDHIVLP